MLLAMSWFDGLKIQGLFEGAYTSYVILIVVLLVVIKFALNEIRSVDTAERVPLTCILSPSAADKTRGGKRGPAVDHTALYPYGVAEMQGKRPYMEDRHTVVGTLNGDAAISFYGVFDGHGGDGASEYCVDYLCANVTSDVAFASNPKQALTRGFIKTDKDYIKVADRTNKDDGTTAVAALVR
ncbi:hypothetical protein As57867_005700, partial [Aphanomyces stellatus]